MEIGKQISKTAESKVAGGPSGPRLESLLTRTPEGTGTGPEPSAARGQCVQELRNKLHQDPETCKKGTPVKSPGASRKTYMGPRKINVGTVAWHLGVGSFAHLCPRSSRYNDT